jgi:hypothetical protein
VFTSLQNEQIMITFQRKETLMDEINQTERRRALLKKSHMPAHSMFYDKVVPILLVGMGIVTAGLILFAAGVLLGLISF